MKLVRCTICFTTCASPGKELDRRITTCLKCRSSTHAACIAASQYYIFPDLSLQFLKNVKIFVPSAVHAVKEKISQNCSDPADLEFQLCEAMNNKYLFEGHYQKLPVAG